MPGKWRTSQAAHRMLDIASQYSWHILKRCQEEGLGELEVLDLLARKRVKGRGAIGSRADEPGPFLPNSQGACMLSACVWLFSP